MTSPPPPDVALYVHWPYCARICPYCDFNVVRARGREAEQAALAEGLLRDLEAQAARLGPRRLSSIFFGGGTPSLMRPRWAGALIERAAALFSTGPDLEITLEANPTDAEAGHFRDFASAGVQRLSLGVQSLDDAALKFLGRNHDGAEARRAAEAAIAAFPRLSIDLIYTLPGQTPESWAAELGAALDLAAEHVSPYSLTIEAGTAFDRAVGRGLFRPPEGDAAADLFDVTQAVLEAAGFHAYEVSNHARGEAARSRHNLAIWRGAEYLGVGPGAHGRIVLDGARTATVGARRIGEYLERVTVAGTGFESAEPLTPREALEERVMLGLRIEEGVGEAELDGDILTRAAELERQGLLRRANGRLAATREGRMVLDGVIEALLV